MNLRTIFLYFFLSQLFFPFFVGATVFPTDIDVKNLNTDEVRNPYNQLIPTPFKEETVKQAIKLLKQKNSKVIEYKMVLDLFYSINAHQVTSLLNERKLILGGNPDLKLITTKEINDLYQNPSVKNLINFIIANELSSKQIFIFLFPFLRDQSLEASQIIEILNSISFDINTVLKGEDLISLFLDSSFKNSSKDTDFEELVLKPRQNNIVIPDVDPVTFKLLQSFLSPKDQEVLPSLSQKEMEKDKTVNPFQEIKEDKLFFTKQQIYYNPEVIIGSMAHIVMGHRIEELIRFFYGHKNFDPNIVNYMDQTPLHSLFMSYSDGFSKPEKLSVKDWDRLLSLVFDNSKVNGNAKDVHGLTPLAIALSKGLTESFFVFFEREDIDLKVKDNYNRTLVIIASHYLPKKSKKKIINILVEKGGGQLVIPSHFNDYIDQSLNPITIHHIHPLREVILQAFLTLKEKEMSFNNHQALTDLINYDHKLSQSERVRESLRANIVASRSAYYRKPVIHAIKQDDRDFFERFYRKSDDIKNFLEHIFNFPIKNFANSDFILEHIPAYHLLLLAINENSPEVVQFFLETIKKPQIFQPDERSFYMDVLSEALIQSFRLSIENMASQENFEQKNFEQKSFEQESKKSSQIINTILSHDKTNIEFTNFMDLTPMEIAFLTGQIDTVKSLQEKGIALPDGDLWETGVPYLDLTERQGFIKVSNYYRSQKKIKGCYQTFIN